MENEKVKDSTQEFERSYKDASKEKYVLRLYVAGMTRRSMQAIESIKKICEDQLKGCYELEVIDVKQQPSRLKEEDIIATPTLVKKLPLPIRKLIGDLSSDERVVVGLNLLPQKKRKTKE